MHLVAFWAVVFVLDAPVSLDKVTAFERTKDSYLIRMRFQVGLQAPATKLINGLPKDRKFK